VICFDENDKPVAWLAFSEMDGNRFMQPRDSYLSECGMVVWDSFKLAKILDELGLPVPPKAEPDAPK
jgi:hypothetical protein